MLVFSHQNHERKDLERKDLEALCRHLMSQMQDANCTLTVSENNGHTTFDSVVVTGKGMSTTQSPLFRRFQGN